jgi:hypothetical protein
MNQSKEELERPVEWLRRLEEEPRRYRRLFEETGSLALAAHRIASARCRTRAQWVAVPTGSELHAAAHELQRHVPAISHVPASDALADDCDAAGVPVIPPKSDRAA